MARVALISMFLAIHFATISLAAPQNPQPPTQLPIPCLTVMQGDWDGDGLDNLTECQLGTNQMNADSDGDSFNDFDELEYGTDPLNPNSDGDSLTDGCEYQWVMSIDVALDPLVFDVDSDTDEIPDALENWFGLDAGSMDTDQDMLWDREEWKPCPKFAKGCSVSCAM
ncbi:MAG: hypothetical protein ACRDHN_14660, partial [Thermomicrobiales bacterium]